jgi:hypothetical protein
MRGNYISCDNVRLKDEIENRRLNDETEGQQPEDCKNTKKSRE